MKTSSVFMQRSVAGFTLCFLGAGLAFLTFVIYLRGSELPDQTVNWDVLLNNMASVEFCAADSAPVTPSASSSIASSDALTKFSTDDPGLQPKNFSVTMLVTVIPTKELADIPHNITFVHGRLYGYQLGLQDHLELEEVNVTLDIPVVLHRCGQGHCKKSAVITCVHLQAAPHVFPTSSAPEECQRLNESGVEYHTEMQGRKRTLLHVPPSGRCKGSKIQLRRASGSSLSLLLSMPDRSVGSLHLLHTSFFVFVMAVMLIASSLLCNKRHAQQPKQPSSAHVPLVKVRDT